MGHSITITATGGAGEIPAYVAQPAAPAKAAIIVIPEIFGLNAGFRHKVDDWAALGYLAIAPDIFWRFAPGVELDPDVPEQLQEAFGYFQQYDADLGVEDIRAAHVHGVGAIAERRRNENFDAVCRVGQTNDGDAVIQNLFGCVGQ